MDWKEGMHCLLGDFHQNKSWRKTVEQSTAYYISCEGTSAGIQQNLTPTKESHLLPTKTKTQQTDFGSLTSQTRLKHEPGTRNESHIKHLTKQSASHQSFSKGH